MIKQRRHVQADESKKENKVARTNYERMLSCLLHDLTRLINKTPMFLLGFSVRPF